MAVNNTEKFASTKNFGTVQTGDLISTGPYIGVVKNNIDYTRNGRLEVWIPAIGAINPDDPKGWIICQYANPYMGFTNLNQATSAQDYDAVQQSYGMWAVPPDIGIRVLVVFAEHDINQAFWLGTVPEPLKNHMVPSIGSRAYADASGSAVDFSALADYQSEVLKNAVMESLSAYFEESQDTTGLKFPMSEVQFKAKDKQDIENFYSKPRAIHEDIAKQFLLQGLDRDKDRGPISSSAQRETPSNVFGVITPGRLRKDLAADSALISKAKQGELTEEDVKEYINKGDKGRRGGHSLTMDDGDIVGQNNLIRLRTARGHQITMHDTEEFIHITHANGLAWIEIDSRGQISIFSNNSLNIRTGLDLNLRADRDINIEAEDTIRLRGKKFIKAETDDLRIKTFKDTNLEHGGDLTILADGGIALNAANSSGWNSGGTLNLQAPTINLNSGAGPDSPEVPEIEKEKYTDVLQEGFIWKEEEEPSIESILEWIPTHEPYPRRILAKSAQQIAEFYQGLL